MLTANFSDPVALTIDNRAPGAGFSQIRWRVAGGPWLPQNTFAWPLWVVPVDILVPVVRAKAIGRPPMSRDPGGGQSWLVGKPALIGESAGTQGLPLLASVARV